jgi:methylamine---glutamate N-methyltransferase subunit A
VCGIAGIIYRDDVAEHDVGSDMTRMLQSMKHRGPDSTGYALYRPPSVDVIMRYKLADANDPRDFDFQQRLDRYQAEVERRLRLAGAEIDEVEADTEYA